MKFFGRSICVLMVMCSICCEVAQGQWVQVTAYPGDVMSIGSDGSSMYLSGTSGLLRSTDDGTTWQAVNDKTNGPLAISGTELFAGSRSGLFRSTDNGLTWASTALDNIGVNSVYATAGSVLAGTFKTTDFTYHGPVISTDNGSNWSAVLGLDDAGATCFVRHGTDIYAGTQSAGIYVSHDNGQSWAGRSEGLATGQIFALGSKGADLYAGVGLGKGSIYKSTDEGSTWIHNVDLPKAEFVYQLLAAGDNLFAGTGHGVFVSSNDGKSWREAGSTPNFLTVYSLAVIGNDLYAGSSHTGLWRRPLSDFSTLEVSANPNNAALKISPNPTSGLTTILGRSISQIEVLNIQGQSLITVEQPVADEILIDLTQLSAGCYFVRLVEGESVITRVIIKQ